MFLLAVLYVLQGKRKMSPIIPALTASPHNTGSVSLVSCSRVGRLLKKRRPHKSGKSFCEVSISCAEALISLLTVLSLPDDCDAKIGIIPDNKKCGFNRKYKIVNYLEMRFLPSVEEKYALRYHSCTKGKTNLPKRSRKPFVHRHLSVIAHIWPTIPLSPLRMENEVHGFPQGTYSFSVTYARNSPDKGPFLYVAGIGIPRN